MRTDQDVIRELEQRVLELKLSLRDMFAMSVLPTVYAKLPEWGAPHPAVALECYKVADAMLKERENQC
jgi:hypothetical protein